MRTVKVLDKKILLLEDIFHSQDQTQNRLSQAFKRTAEGVREECFDTLELVAKKNMERNDSVEKKLDKFLEWFESAISPQLQAMKGELERECKRREEGEAAVFYANGTKL